MVERREVKLNRGTIGNRKRFMGKGIKVEPSYQTSANGN
jgi:hypothetical protein